MSLSYTLRLPSDFPAQLLRAAKSLETSGIDTLVWDWENAIAVVEAFSEYNYAILGGDVYCVTNDEIRSTYDSWYLNKDIRKSRKDFVGEAKSKAISYINQYQKRHGDNFYYSIVFEKI